MARDQKLVLETQEKSTINTVTTLSELLEKYGNNAKILKIKFSQLISLIKCCKNCLAITSGPGCLISQTGKCNLQRSFNISKFSLFEEVQTKYSKNHNILMVSTNEIINTKSPRKAFHFFDREGILIHRLLIYSYEDFVRFENRLSKIQTVNFKNFDDSFSNNISKNFLFNTKEKILNKDWWEFSLQDHLNSMIDYGPNFRFSIIKELPSIKSRKLDFDLLKDIFLYFKNAELPILKFGIRPGFAQASQDILKAIVPISSILMLYGEFSCFGIDQRKIKECRLTFYNHIERRRSLIELFDFDNNIIAVFHCGFQCNSNQIDLWEKVINTVPMYQ